MAKVPISPSAECQCICPSARHEKGCGCQNKGDFQCPWWPGSLAAFIAVYWWPQRKGTSPRWLGRTGHPRGISGVSNALWAPPEGQNVEYDRKAEQGDIQAYKGREYIPKYWIVPSLGQCNNNGDLGWVGSEQILSENDPIGPFVGTQPEAIRGYNRPFAITTHWCSTESWSCQGWEVRPPEGLGLDHFRALCYEQYLFKFERNGIYRKDVALSINKIAIS